jgi:Holliday junction resolvasome RuvABC ATP-dependent DNA helicase subunit
LTKIATTLRGNPRQAQKMATNMTGHLAATGSSKFGSKDWDDLQDQLGVHPLGLNDKEIEILQHLEQGGSLTLTNLSARTGLTKQCLQADYELWLLKMGLMKIETTGRALTIQGCEYLKFLNLPPLEVGLGMQHISTTVKKDSKHDKVK